jgi:anti-anti-sigma regulatory factor
MSTLVADRRTDGVSIEIGHHLDEWSVAEVAHATITLLNSSAHPPERVELHMSDTWTIDSEGLRLLGMLSKECRFHGCGVVVTDASWEIRRILVDARLADERVLDAGGRRGAAICCR